MPSPQKAIVIAGSTEPRYFLARLTSFAPNLPLPCDVFLANDQRGAPTLIKRRGESFTVDQMRELAERHGENLLVRDEHRPEYLRSLRDAVHDPGSTQEMRSRFIKESAFLHVHDLFTRKEILPVVNDAKSLVEAMVAFVSGDISAVATLMKLSSHDYYTYNHCVNVGVYSIVLAKMIYGDNQDMLIAAGLGGLLHDIGKRRLDWSLINKRGALTPDEWREIKRHPEYGMSELSEGKGIAEPVKKAVFEHHEAFDGTGYPRGLTGDEISELSRIVTIADVFDALTTHRTYHKAMPPQEALAKMFGMQPGKFDPRLFRLFNRNFEEKPPGKLPDDFDPCSPAPVPKPE